MSYGTVYTLPFKSIKGKDYLIKIEREGYAGAATELKGQRSPFTVSVDGEDGFIYQPARFSTATLSIFGGDYLQDLFSTDYRMHRITLYEGGVAAWCGFIKPEMYTQDYRSVKFPLDLECYSAMSVLEYIDYKQQGDTRGFVSLWALLKHCISESRGQYTAVYLPHVYGKDKSAFEAWENPLEQMSVSEQNFFDEDNEPMKLKEVLEEIMKLLNWTCNDWQGELYFTDADNEDGNYYKYDLAMAEYTKVKANSVTVQEAGFAGADHTLDIVPGYNKAIIRCSNYPVGDALPDLSFDELIYLGDYYYTFGLETGSPYRLHNRVYCPTKFETLATEYDNSTESYKKIDAERQKEILQQEHNDFPFGYGCYPEKSEFYYTDESGNPKSKIDHSFKEQWDIKISWKGENVIGINEKAITIKGANSAYKGGVFSLSAKVVLSSHWNPVKQEEINVYEWKYMLRIGNMYLHSTDEGEYEWNENPNTYDKFTNNIQIEYQSEEEQKKSEDRDNAYDDAWATIYKIKTVGRKFDDGLDGIDGMIFKLPNDKVLSGELEFAIYMPKIHFSHTDRIPYPEYIRRVYLEDFKFERAEYEFQEETEDSDSDRIYENIINEDYINELDEIEMKLSSYNNDGACYSKVMLGDNYLEDNLYCGITGGNIRPEELLIRRIIDHYSATKIKLTQVLKKAAIKPFTILSDKYMDDKKFMNIGGEIDYKMNRFTCIMLEI